jgi:hypothetical protein
VVEELADLILSADIETVEVIQHRYGEQVDKIFYELYKLILGLRYLIVYLQHLLMFV